MDSSKFLEDIEECSSNESGWTMYILSPERGFECEDSEDDEEDCSIGEQFYKQDAKKDAEDVDSDDSMASDASSGPSYQGKIYQHVGRFHGFIHAGNKRENERAVKKRHQEEGKKHDEQIKEAKDKYEQKKYGSRKSKNM